MSRSIWFNCCAGVAGDMLLAALVDAGADRLDVMAAWGSLGVDGFAGTWERVQRCGVAALWTNLAIDDHDDHDIHDIHDHDTHDVHDDRDRDIEPSDGHAHPHRPARDVLAMIAGADLPTRVRDDAIAVYRRLAEVEGAIHGVDPDDVELHEVGALDSILDVVGVCAALHSLGASEISYSPIAVGHGTVTTAHGVLPNPVPAVSRLLATVGARTVGIDTTMELSTPTGVALLTVLGQRCGPMPDMAVTATGFGAGTADPQGRPNVVQAIVGDDARPVDTTGRPCHLVEANVDDVTGEVLAHTIGALIDAGAHDAWATPIVMKKGRPAHTVSALCDQATMARVRQVLIDETGTLGVRATTVQRWPQHRDQRVVDVDGHEVRVKVSGHRAKAEHDDARAAAIALGIPLREVLARAEHAARTPD
jgi:pyridinium-3,5-bisthiocarboxylic acid mononucleotide nickel chelatase